MAGSHAVTFFGGEIKLRIGGTARRFRMATMISWLGPEAESYTSPRRTASTAASAREVMFSLR